MNNYDDESSHLLFSGLEFVEKLAALVPPPRIHLTRFFGCLAPHSRIRAAIVPKKEELPEQTPVVTPESESTPKKKRRMGWAELLARVFAIDITTCPQCGGELKVIAAIVEVSAIKKILGHLDLPDKPPDFKPPVQIPSIRNYVKKEISAGKRPLD